MKSLLLSTPGMMVIFGLLAACSSAEPQETPTPTPARSAGRAAATTEPEQPPRPGALGTTLLESSQTGIDVFANFDAVYSGRVDTKGSLVVLVTRNRHFSAAKRPRGGWIQVGDKRFRLGPVDADSMLMFGVARLPAVGAGPHAVAVCIDDEAEDTDGKCLVFHESQRTR